MISVAQLTPHLAKGWEKKCIELGVIQRQRGIKTPGDLMMLCLFHLVTGCSLMEISEVGRLLKIGEFSDVAFMKKFEKCKDWFTWNCEQLSPKIVVEYKRPTWLYDYRAIAFDASEVVEKGRSGQRYRLHYGIDIFHMCTVSYKITKLEIGETLCNFPLKKGDLAIADRIYGTTKGVEHCQKNGADFVLRLRASCFAIYDGDGNKIELLSQFSNLDYEQTREFSGFIKGGDGTLIPVRVCVKRKSEQDCEKTRKRLRSKEINFGTVMKDETKKFNEFIVLSTSLPSEISADEVLEAYRYRWQIECYFKRLKSIMNFGELPKKRENSCLSWLAGKLMVALLIELLLASIAFSPGDAQKSEPQYLAGDEIDQSYLKNRTHFAESLATRIGANLSESTSGKT